MGEGFALGFFISEEFIDEKLTKESLKFFCEADFFKGLITEEESSLC